jgi:hypothetical protein
MMKKKKSFQHTGFPYNHLTAKKIVSGEMRVCTYQISDFRREVD